VVRSEHAGRVLAAAFLSGCAAHPAPTGQLAASEMAIAGAILAGAAELAPRELELAQEKLGLGRRWMAAKDYQPARWLLDQATTDAELAELKAIAIKARKASPL
jgi:uncharacterized protein DUF4398